MATRPVHVVSREVPPEFQLRMAVALGVVFVAFALVGIRLWYLQIERGAQMRYYSEKNRIRLVRVPAPRGVVYDRNGEILVDNRPSFDVVFVPEDAGERRRQVLKTLAGYLGEEEAGLHPGVHGAGSDRERYQGIVLRRDVDWQGVVALETHQLDLPGISLRVAPQRYYPVGPLAAHLLGYVGEVSKSELAQDDGDYVGGDLVGKAGLEKSFDKDLRGDPGDQQVEVDALGRRVRVLQEEPDRSGGTLTLTLDRDLQEAADRALGEADGAIVRLDLQGRGRDGRAGGRRGDAFHGRDLRGRHPLRQPFLPLLEEGRARPRQPAQGHRRVVRRMLLPGGAPAGRRWDRRVRASARARAPHRHRPPARADRHDPGHRVEAAALRPAVVRGRDAFGGDRPGLRDRHAAPDGEPDGDPRQRRHPPPALLREAGRRRGREGARGRARGARPGASQEEHARAGARGHARRGDERERHGQEGARARHRGGGEDGHLAGGQDGRGPRAREPRRPGDARPRVVHRLRALRRARDRDRLHRRARGRRGRRLRRARRAAGARPLLRPPPGAGAALPANQCASTAD